MIVNARTHLDSDIAVDGLTLIEALRGDWRWHYPATPHIGIGAVLLSYPQASLWGATPQTLVSGGLVAYELLVLTTFLLAWRVGGPKVAAWSLLPLTFASTGMIWLSGRVTGGHLLTAFWHTSAFLMLYECLRSGGFFRTAALGFWCGVGLYLDQMFALSLLAIVTIGLAAWIATGGRLRGLALAAIFVIFFGLGVWPRKLGQEREPYDAYPGQFGTILTAASPEEAERPVEWKRVQKMGLSHARTLLLDCLPRLLAGHRLPGLESEPEPASLPGGAPRRAASDPGVVAALTTGLVILLVPVGVFGLMLGPPEGSEAEPEAESAVRWGLIATSLAVLGAFVLSRNIYNSDNYRYLVLLVPAWSLGLALSLDRISRAGLNGKALGGSLAACLAVLMTIDTVQWYASFGWINPAGLPAQSVRTDPALEWLEQHPDVDAIFGDYWDVYRLSFLTHGRVAGVPYPVYPNRFPEWSDRWPKKRPSTLIVRNNGGFGPFYSRRAQEDGATLRFQGRGIRVYDWP